MQLRYLVLALAACGAPARPRPPMHAPARVAADDAEIAPESTAGLYWLPYHPCDRCAQPAALAAYLVPDALAARTIARALEGKLPFGLPYIVHTEELAVSPSAIAVVIGTFASRDAALAAAARASAIAGHRAEVIDVAGGDRWVESPHHVTVIDRGAPVPAWSKADVDAVTAALDESDDPDAHATMQTQHAWVQAKLRERAPACTVAPGELFVVADDELLWYEFAPVRCGGALAYVAWTSSLLGHAVIVPDGAGHRLYQVVGAQCDSPIIDEWRYDERGRHRAGEGGSLLAMGRC
jgi:hypothetical protein